MADPERQAGNQSGTPLTDRQLQMRGALVDALITRLARKGNLDQVPVSPVALLRPFMMIYPTAEEDLFGRVDKNKNLRVELAEYVIGTLKDRWGLPEEKITEVPGVIAVVGFKQSFRIAKGKICDFDKARDLINAHFGVLGKNDQK